ncbi:hypothetical protein niasHS_016602 [Heterodera schachtii]|uniref:Uncharacterized protein n=1 Tax=Heterodera schachtii TaxID=97005 RepID=A0ABD2HYG4_HETSC
MTSHVPTCSQNCQRVENAIKASVPTNYRHNDIFHFFNYADQKINTDHLLLISPRFSFTTDTLFLTEQRSFSRHSSFFVRSSGKDRFFQHDCASIAAAVPCAVCAEDTDRRAFAGRSPLRYELWRTTSST